MTRHCTDEDAVIRSWRSRWQSLRSDMPADLGFVDVIQPRTAGMSAKRQRLVRQIAQLVECSVLLRGDLQHYERTMKRIASQLENGHPAIAASGETDIADERRRVTESIEQFEAARHQLRLALMAVGREEGASISDVGRVLGISRQLASRLAAEAKEDDGQ